MSWLLAVPLIRIQIKPHSAWLLPTYSVYLGRRQSFPPCYIWATSLVQPFDGTIFDSQRAFDSPAKEPPEGATKYDMCASDDDTGQAKHILMIRRSWHYPAKQPYSLKTKQLIRMNCRMSELFKGHVALKKTSSSFGSHLNISTYSHRDQRPGC